MAWVIRGLGLRMLTRSCMRVMCVSGMRRWLGGCRRVRMLSLSWLRPLIWRRCLLRNGSRGSMISAWMPWMMSPGMGVGRGSW